MSYWTVILNEQLYPSQRSPIWPWSCRRSRSDIGLAWEGLWAILGGTAIMHAGLKATAMMTYGGMRNGVATALRIRERIVRTMPTWNLSSPTGVKTANWYISNPLLPLVWKMFEPLTATYGLFFFTASIGTGSAQWLGNDQGENRGTV
jgi:hypothetical protein